MAADCFSVPPFSTLSISTSHRLPPLCALSYLSRPGPVAPSRSCCLQPGSSSPTPQSSMPLSSPTPWAAHSLSPTGGEQRCFLTFNCQSLPSRILHLLMSEYCGLQFLNPPFFTQGFNWIHKSNSLTYVILKLQKQSTLFIHITSGPSL